MKRRYIGRVIIPFLVLVAVVSIYYSQAASQTTEPPARQQSEIAELKKQVAELEQRIDRLEERLADVYKPKLWPLPLTSEGQEKSGERKAKPRSKNP